jgi:phospholipase/carboxylesterase
MLSRRDVLLGLPLIACSREKSAPSWPRRTSREGVDFIELFPNGADESSPLVVAVHGKGDRPDNWIDTWSQFPARAEIALPRGFDTQGGGFKWFEFADGMTDDQFGAVVGAVEERLWKGVAALAGQTRRLVITGFSQGGFFAFAMATRHPDRVAASFPVGGSCPGPLLPKNKARAAPVFAFHGTEDKVLDIKWARGAVNAYVEQGDRAVLKEYPGVGHTITSEMRADLWAEIGRALQGPLP